MRRFIIPIALLFILALGVYSILVSKNMLSTRQISPKPVTEYEISDYHKETLVKNNEHAGLADAHFKMAEDIVEISPSIALLHYYNTLKHLDYFKCGRVQKISVDWFGESEEKRILELMRFIDEEKIPDTRMKAIVKAKDDIAECALYLLVTDKAGIGYGRTYSIIGYKQVVAKTGYEQVIAKRIFEIISATEQVENVERIRESLDTLGLNFNYVEKPNDNDDEKQHQDLVELLNKHDQLAGNPTLKRKYLREILLANLDESIKTSVEWGLSESNLGFNTYEDIWKCVLAKAKEPSYDNLFDENRLVAGLKGCIKGGRVDDSRELKSILVAKDLITLEEIAFYNRKIALAQAYENMGLVEDMNRINGNFIDRYSHFHFIQSWLEIARSNCGYPEKAFENVMDWKYSYFDTNCFYSSKIRALEGAIPLLFNKYLLDMAYECVQETSSIEYCQEGDRAPLMSDWRSEYVSKFARAGRFDLAFKTIPLVLEDSSLIDALVDIAMIVEETGYDITENDKRCLRALVFNRAFFRKYGYEEIKKIIILKTGVR